MWRWPNSIWLKYAEMKTLVMKVLRYFEISLAESFRCWWNDSCFWKPNLFPFTAKILRLNVSISSEDFFSAKNFIFSFFVTSHLRTVILIAVDQYFSSQFVASSKTKLIGRWIQNLNLKTFSTSNQFTLFLILLTKTILQKLNYKMKSDLTQTNSSVCNQHIISIVGKPMTRCYKSRGKS